MKTRIYHREETDTFDEINKVLNELRNEIVEEFKVLRDENNALKMRINNLENPEVLAPIPKKKPKKKKPSAKNKKK